MDKRVLVILGHPSTDSFCGALTDTYVQAAMRAGHDVRVLQLGALSFDPLLHAGYKQVQPLEPELLKTLTFGPLLACAPVQREAWLKQAKAVAGG